MSLDHIFWATANALWQSAVIAVIVAVSLRVIPRTTAAQRYALWFAVLVAAALLPIADLAMPSRTIAVPVNAPPAPVQRVVTQVSHVVAPPIDVHAFVTPATHRITLPDLPSPLVVLWIAVASGLLIRLAVAYASLRRIKASLVAHDALTARVQAFNGVWSRHAIVGVSPRVAEPCAIGFLHPAIALSTEMATNLSEPDLERVLRHEYAHVRRYDDYANLLQRICAVILWFNPVVHFAGRAMATEREIACDDAAAAASDERVAFARCLYEIARTASPRRHAAASGFIGSRRQITVRVARLVERNHNASTRLGSFAKITAVTVLAVALALAGVRLTALAVPQAALPTQTVDPSAPLGLMDALANAGFKNLSPDDLIRFADHGVRPELIDQLHAFGLTPMPADALVRLADSGVNGAYIGGLAQLGYRNLAIEDYIRLHDAGVTVEFVQRLLRSGLVKGRPSVDQLIKLANSGI